MMFLNKYKNKINEQTQSKAPLLIALSGFLFSACANAEFLQPRDLDNDSSTVEAYFDPELNITWLADANIGLTQTFGLQRSENFSSRFGTEIRTDGSMLGDGVELYVPGMVQSNYQGFSGWRLPVAQQTGDTTCSAQSPSTGFSWGMGCTRAEVGSLNQRLIDTFGSLEDSPFINLDSRNRFLGSRGIAGQHFYSFGGAGDLQFCSSGGCPSSYVWPVHDGDIGVAILEMPMPMQTDCIDSDGDGWGWNGSASCRVESVSGMQNPTSAVCVDTPPANDGWGWDGATSCRIVVSSPTCVDSPPLNDGWGWNGVTSCRVREASQTPDQMPGQTCFDSPPLNDDWGWNGSASCRI